MAATGDPIGPSAEGPDVSDKQQEAQGAPSGDAAPVAVANGLPVPSQNAPEAELMTVQQVADRGDLELLTRFLTGIMLLGGDVLMQRIREVRGDLAAHPEFTAQTASLDEASTRDLARYLAIGLTRRGQARLVQGVRRGFDLSLGTASWAFGLVNRATDNWLMRPVRKPVESRLRLLDRESVRVIREGKVEEQKSRLLAQEAVFEIIDDVIEFVAENPEAAAWIQDILAGQTAGLTTSLRDNARQFTVSSDGRAEDLVRRMLRRPARRTLPESPLAGEPQTMYSPESAGQMVEAHEQRESDRE